MIFSFHEVRKFQKKLLKLPQSNILYIFQKNKSRIKNFQKKSKKLPPGSFRTAA